jgi:hypothetical protein
MHDYSQKDNGSNRQQCLSRHYSVDLNTKLYLHSIFGTIIIIVIAVTVLETYGICV